MQLLRLWSCCSPPAVAAEPDRATGHGKQLELQALGFQGRQPPAHSTSNAVRVAAPAVHPPPTAGDARGRHQDDFERKPSLPATVAVFTTSNSPSNTDHQPEPDNHTPLASVAGSGTAADVASAPVTAAAATYSTVHHLASNSSGDGHPHHHPQQQQQQQRRPRRTISWQQEQYQQQQLHATSAPTSGLLRCMSAEHLALRGPTMPAAGPGAPAAAGGGLQLAGCSSHSLAVAPSECTFSALVVASSGGVEGGLPRCSSSPVAGTAESGVVGAAEALAAPTRHPAATQEPAAPTSDVAAVLELAAASNQALPAAAAGVAVHPATHLPPTTPDVRHPAAAMGGYGCSALTLSITSTSSSGTLGGPAGMAVLAELGSSPTASSTVAAAAGTQVEPATAASPGAAAVMVAPPVQTIARRVSPFAGAIEAAVAALAEPGTTSTSLPPTSPHLAQPATPSPAAAAAALLRNEVAAHGGANQGAAAPPGGQQMSPLTWAQHKAGGGSIPSCASRASGERWPGHNPPYGMAPGTSSRNSAAGGGSVVHTPTSQQRDNHTAAAAGGAMETGQVFNVLQANELMNEADSEEPHNILKTVRSAPSLRGGRLSFSSTASSTWGSQLLPSRSGLGTTGVRLSRSSSRGRGSEARRVAFQVPEADLRSSLHIDVSTSRKDLGGDSSSSRQGSQLHTAHSAPAGTPAAAALAVSSSSGSRSIKGLASVFSFGRRHSNKQHRQQQLGAEAASVGAELAPAYTSSSSNLASPGPSAAFSSYPSSSITSSKPPLQPCHSSGDLLASPVTRSLSLRSSGSSGSLLLVAHQRSVTSSVTGGTSSGWSTSASSSSTPCNQPAVAGSSSSASLVSLDVQPLAPATPGASRPGVSAGPSRQPAAGAATKEGSSPAAATATAAAQEAASKFASSFLAALAAGDTKWASAPAVAELFEEAARMVGLDKQLYIGRTAILRRLNAGMEQLVKMAASYQTDTPAAASSGGDSPGAASHSRPAPSAVTSVTSPDPVKRPGYTVVTYTFKWGLRKFLFRDEFVVKQGCIVRLRRSRG